MDLETAMCAARDLYRTHNRPVGIYHKGDNYANLDSQDFYAAVPPTTDPLVMFVTAAD